MDIKDYITNKLQDLAQYGITFSEDKLNEFYQSLLEQNLSDEEMKAQVDNAYENALKNQEKKRLDDLARNGEYSNFDQVKEAFNCLMGSPIGQYIAIYGSTVPYLMTNKTPKRLIGDIDCHCSIENMDKVREFVRQHPEMIDVETDTLDYSNDDYGIELIIAGLNVSVFPTVETPEGRITKNFVYHKSLGTVEETATIFYGLHDENELITADIEGKQVKVSCPEYIYLQKARAMREKDVIDMEVLQPMINQDKVSYLRSVTKTPETLKKEFLRKQSDIKTL